jgi:ParB family chromosome partitioning protein
MGEVSAMKGRDALRELLGAGKPEATPNPPVHRSTGAVKAMNLGLQRLSEEAAAAKSLRATLANSEQVVELDVGDVDDSFIVDRISSESDPGFASLKSAIATHGQQVPILVRPHPEHPKRYQAAYGHRRLRAARELGRAIKAVVKNLTDVELVVAQGQENSERADLSFIERAVFASHLEQRGFDRETMTAALGVDKPELSRLLSVASGVGNELTLAIGPAPKIGRPRWLALVERLTEPSFRESANRVISSAAFSKADTNLRFSLVLGAQQIPTPRGKEPLQTVRGQRVAWVERTSKGIRLVSEDRAFVAFLDQRLPDLLREFESRE